MGERDKGRRAIRTGEEPKPEKKEYRESELEKAYEAKLKKHSKTYNRRKRTPFSKALKTDIADGKISADAIKEAKKHFTGHKHLYVDKKVATQRRAYKVGDLEKYIQKIRTKNAYHRDYKKRTGYNLLATRITGIIVKHERTYIRLRLDKTYIKKEVVRVGQDIAKEIYRELVNINQIPVVSREAEILYRGAIKSTLLQVAAKATVQLYDKINNGEIDGMAVKELVPFMNKVMATIKLIDGEPKRIKEDQGEKKSKFKPIYAHDVIDINIEE